MTGPTRNVRPLRLLTIPDQGSDRLIKFTRADLTVPKPVEWLVEDWLARDTLAGLVGAPGSCKSFLALDWACCIATGMAWLGNEVKQGPVYYLAGEGNSGLRKRITGWEIANNKSVVGAPMYLADCLPELCNQQNTVSVINEIERVADEYFFKVGEDPSLIIIDTLAIAMSGYDENSALDMGLLMHAIGRMRHRWRCCVLVIHHTGHGANTQRRARGSSAYRAALDSEFAMGSEGSLVTVLGTKAKDWDPPTERRLKKTQIAIDMCGMICKKETTLVLSEAIDNRSKHDPRREGVLRLVDEGRSVRSIAEETGIPKTTIHRWAVAAGVSGKRADLHSPRLPSPRPVPTPLKGGGVEGQDGNLGHAARDSVGHAEVMWTKLGNDP